jgi:hypothetical protein
VKPKEDAITAEVAVEVEVDYAPMTIAIAIAAPEVGAIAAPTAIAAPAAIAMRPAESKESDVTTVNE